MPLLMKQSGVHFSNTDFAIALYKTGKFGAELEGKYTWRVFKTRLFMEGHSMDEINSLSLVEVADIMAYMANQHKLSKR